MVLKPLVVVFGSVACAYGSRGHSRRTCRPRPRGKTQSPPFDFSLRNPVWYASCGTRLHIVRLTHPPKISTSTLPFLGSSEASPSPRPSFRSPRSLSRRASRHPLARRCGVGASSEARAGRGSSHLRPRRAGARWSASTHSLRGPLDAAKRARTWAEALPLQLQRE